MLPDSTGTQIVPGNTGYYPGKVLVDDAECIPITCLPDSTFKKEAEEEEKGVSGSKRYSDKRKEERLRREREKQERLLRKQNGEKEGEEKKEEKVGEKKEEEGEEKKEGENQRSVNEVGRQSFKQMTFRFNLF